MNKEAQQVLRDSHIKPTNEIIAGCLGETYKVYVALLEALKTEDITLMDWRFYNDGKAWLSKGEYHWVTARGTSKVKPIFWVSMWDSYFKISFNFAEKTKDKLLALPLGEKTKKCIHDVVPNGDKVKFIPVIFDVEEEEQLHDILLLSRFRKEHS